MYQSREKNCHCANIVIVNMGIFFNFIELFSSANPNPGCSFATL